MRPLQLSFSGIRSYPGQVGPLDFTGKTLIAIVGDTGAGKSTILEAITLALYGNCTWTDRESRALIAEGAAHMSVDFTFAHDGQQWRVRRHYHSNTTPASHLLQNLGTGEHEDGKRAVDRKIESLLQLSFESFATAVLLPQGRFDRLLTATGRERTGLLKSIFGVQVIETVKDRATHHRDELTSLVHQAELARQKLLEDPAATAAAERAQAAEADKVAGQLRRALDALRGHRSQASAAREHHQTLSSALHTLQEQEPRDTAAELSRISAAEKTLAAAEDTATQLQEHWNDQRAEAAGKLEAAAREGFTVESLSGAATVLDALPGKVAELTATGEQLDADAAALAAEATQLAAAEAALADLRAAAGSLALAHKAASAAAERNRTSRSNLEDAVRRVLRRAAETGKAQRDESAALAQEADIAGTVPALAEAAAAAEDALRVAEDHLGHARSQDAAHIAGAGLTAGEPCLICTRPLPGGYQPPEPANPGTLRAADAAVRKARKAERDAANALTSARSQASSAQAASTASRSAAQGAQGRLEQARQAAAGVKPDPDGNGQPAQAGWPGDPAFDQLLESACSQMAADAGPEQDDLLRTLLTGILDLSARAQQELEDAASQAAEAAAQARSQAEAEQQTVSLRLEHHQRDTYSLAAARERHVRAAGACTKELAAALPAPVKAILAAELASITEEQIRQAGYAVSRQQEQVTALAALRGRAADKAAEAAAELRDLERRRQEEVTGRLHSLSSYLERRQDRVERAGRALPGEDGAAPLPERPAGVTLTGITAYAAALALAEETTSASLAQETFNAADTAETQLKRLQDAAARLSAGKDALPVIALPAGDELLGPSSLDSLVSAETTARNDAARHRSAQETAESQIQRAASLDTALGGGRSRLHAVDVLRGLLAEAKFLQYLTDRRTRALLALASDTFGTLSGGEFGFAADFQVVSRRTGAARGPKTLSGGETFMASLALALALVELHSRSGARLGALFLDEGFASLDADSLSGALAVLQAETGGDKLVAVISHLHAVAEAVPDVLWVERGPAGSAARWLNPDQRDALVRQEVTAGLLSSL